MSKIQVLIINAFVDGDKGGNPAGIVLDADKLSQEQKQHIAAQVGVSETAFVSQSRVAEFKLEFFTPTRQIAHCGHATVATFSYLAQLGRVKGPHSSKETIDGNRAIFISDGMAFMEQLAPRYISLDEVGIGTEAVLSSLSLDVSDLLDGYKPTIVNTGNGFLLVPLKDSATVARIKPNSTQISGFSEQLDLIGYYAFSTQTVVAGRDAGARMFAPFYGIPEESATGMAAGPLACFLFDLLGIKKTRFIIEQGHLMTPPSPSELTVDLSLTKGQIEKLMAGGRAAVSRTIELEVD